MTIYKKGVRPALGAAALATIPALIGIAPAPVGATSRAGHGRIGPGTAVVAVGRGAPASPAARPGQRPGGAGVVLRYHFIAGQTVAYRVTQTMRVRASGLGPARDGTRTLTSSYTIRERVARVDAAGRASIVVARGVAVARQTADGHTTAVIVPAAVSRESVNADGSEVATTDDTFVDAIRSGAILPPRPVVPGARWAARMDATMQGVAVARALPPLHGQRWFVLAGVSRADGQRVAVIVETGSLRYAARAALPGGTWARLQATLATHSRDIFGLTVGRLVAVSAHLDLRVTAIDAATDQRPVEDVTSDVTMRLTAG